MATITFRTDEFVDEALRELTSGDVDRSTAIREAILEAWQHRKNEALREETLRIANDPADRAEIQAIQRDFEDLRAW
jgi:hypothetical protein